MGNILDENIDYLERVVLALKDVKFNGEENMKVADHFKIRLDIVDSFVRVPIQNLRLEVVEKLNPAMPIANTSLETKYKNVLLENGFNTVRQINDEYHKLPTLFDTIDWMAFESWWRVHRSEYDF